MLKIGVVVLNYNSYTLSVNLVNKLSEWDIVDNVCLIDNNSRDNFDDVQFGKKVKYIKNHENTGYAAGNNVGLRFLIEECCCDYVFISNPDVIFEESTLLDMCNTLEQNDNIAIVSTKRYGPNKSRMHQYHYFPSFKTSFFKNFLVLGKLVDRHETYEKQIKRVEDADKYLVVDAVPGAFFGIRSSFLKEIGYLYEGTFLYREEVILGQQVKALGYKAVVINTSTHIHDHHIAHLSNKKMYALDRKSMMIYYNKFNLLSPIQTILLKGAITFGCIEYNLACDLYKLLKR